MNGESSLRRLKADRAGAAQSQQPVTRRGWVVADFFVYNYRVSGSVDVRRLPLADQLNDTSVSYLTLEDAYLSPLDRPGEITSGFATATVPKENITMAVLVNKDDGLSKKQGYGIYHGVSKRNVFLILPQFEVRGYVHTVGKLDLDSYLATGSGRFIPVFDGTIFVSVKPEIRFAGGVVLVNKDPVGVMCERDDD